MEIKCGIIGLPNVGKSTLFNALTQTSQAQAANYPFCTIDPNIGRVEVPDERLNIIAKIAASEKIIPTQIEFVDIAGLVRGASKGEGLGNQFLSHIREVDALLHVVRCFDDDDIIHVENVVNPISDIEIIEYELIIADIDSLEKRLPNMLKKAKQNKELLSEITIIEQLIQFMKHGKSAHNFITDENRNQIKNLQLLTSKPILYVLNVSESEIHKPNTHLSTVEAKLKNENAKYVIISAQIESEIASLENLDEKAEFLVSIGLDETGLNKLVKSSFKLLNLQTYFTAGPQEARAWAISIGFSAPQAAGEIHTDFEKGFIKAETIAYEDYVKFNGEQGARLVGKLRQEGREYIVNDGDIMHFKFNN